MTQETQTGTLEELNVKPGDVVECVDIVREGNRHYVTLGKKYTISSNGAYIDDEGDECRGFSELFRIVSRAATDLTIEAGKYYKTRDGRKVGPMDEDNDGDFDIKSHDDVDLQEQIWCPDGKVWHEDGDESGHYLIAEWTDTHAATPPTWGEMTDAEKGALLLAELDGGCLEQKGRVIVNGESLFRWAPKQEGCWLDSFAYRIKPEPLVETVNIGLASTSGGKWYQPGSPGSAATHRITFNTTNGEPDLDSIKMERING